MCWSWQRVVTNSRRNSFWVSGLRVFVWAVYKIWAFTIATSTIQKKTLRHHRTDFLVNWQQAILWSSRSTPSMYLLYMSTTRGFVLGGEPANLSVKLYFLHTMYNYANTRHVATFVQYLYFLPHVVLIFTSPCSRTYILLVHNVFLIFLCSNLYLCKHACLYSLPLLLLMNTISSQVCLLIVYQ